MRFAEASVTQKLTANFQVREQGPIEHYPGSIPIGSNADFSGQAAVELWHLVLKLSVGQLKITGLLFLVDMMLRGPEHHHILILAQVPSHSNDEGVGAIPCRPELVVEFR
ncbi:hypothetical protein BDBG_02153 [Blastomyces gilchristii SLH14081]|uniref:Uncharacterized protein n=1 Tax=Blastomyces gilchristii (strain SLH14081) TaxID=559298 RepID=A0A179UCV3_BLAGS|nr:uncharacterized protein BDBG_02153 [Blastomyces gilchristii SLH14081]OAT05826.1 hypothetical protein BDBG_02153 [Blastomyces gilchristii SLH14081]